MVDLVGAHDVGAGEASERLGLPPWRIGVRVHPEFVGNATCRSGQARRVSGSEHAVLLDAVTSEALELEFR